MAQDGKAWHDGRRAWERLTGWSEERGHPDDGDAALTALSDVGQVRRLLDQAELVAVRTARKHGKAWAEIATRLGVTRQSAWERWRDLDDAPTLDALIEREAGVVVERALSRRARRSVGEPSVVPDVVGLSFDDARAVLFGAKLVAIGPDPDGPPLGALGWPRGVVVRQDPAPGSLLPTGSPVTVWLDSGGGAGDREPRRPRPNPVAGRDLPDELSGEAAAFG
jgi:hypothetical protein